MWTQLIDLGNMPLVNDFRGKEAERFPLRVRLDTTGLVSLMDEVPREKLFPPEYPYRSGTTKALRENFKELAQEIRKFGSSVLEIGSNDGTLLENLRDLKHLGVDPSNATKEAAFKGLNVVQEYFGDLYHGGGWDVISASNVFAHMPMDGLMEAVDAHLDNEGVFISESHYFPKLVTGLQWDAIYHEHIRYYTLFYLWLWFKDYGFRIFDVVETDVHGGSIRVYADRGLRERTDRFYDLLEREERVCFTGFEGLVEQNAFELREMLRGKRMWAVGAPSRSVTLVNYAGIEENLLGIMEVPGNPKIGKKFPGTDLEVVEEVAEVDEVLILSWHIAKDVLGNLRRKGFKGKAYIPIKNVVEEVK